MSGVIHAEFKLFGVVKREGNWYVAHCPPLDLTTQGRTLSEAKRNLMEASEMFIVSCLERGTLEQALRELGFAPVKHAPERLPENAFRMVIPVPMRFQKSVQCPA